MKHEKMIFKYNLSITKRFFIYINVMLLLGLLLVAKDVSAQTKLEEVISTKDTLVYHPICISKKEKTILPWYSYNPGESYDFVINKVWNFWDTMRTDYNGLPYYMNHQVWQEDANDTRGIAGSQFEMALSSWRLYYQYSGNPPVRENMKFIADYYISHSLSPGDAKFANLPYPYNTLSYSGMYDGDMVIGRFYKQPDKAGSFANELVYLFKLIGYESHGQTPTNIYLGTAVKIANSLAENMVEGDENTSPLPFKVHAILGRNGKIIDMNGKEKQVELFDYTSNWSGTMELFLQLIEMKKGNTVEYQKAFTTLLNWMKMYPLKNNRWGPFFEDIVGESETQINAITFAQFMMNHQEYFPNWKTKVKGIIAWVYKMLGNNSWLKYGVTVINEQTAYKVPGNSHTARQAACELQYAALTGDSTYVNQAILQLNWATYLVDNDGKNRYPQDDIWLSDGYGDYVRHYLRAMAFFPKIASSNQNHLLSSTSVIQFIKYFPEKNTSFESKVRSKNFQNTLLNYRTFDNISTEVFRLTKKPAAVLINQKNMSELKNMDNEGWFWKTLDEGGVLTVRHSSGNSITILKD